MCGVDGRFTLFSSFPRDVLSPVCEDPVQGLSGQMVMVERCHDSPDPLELDTLSGETTSSEVGGGWGLVRGFQQRPGDPLPFSKLSALSLS